MATKPTKKKTVKVRDLKPKKDVKAGATSKRTSHRVT